jgi:phospholipid/cholesterol/gamma-HCH transport system permease protein
VVRELGPVLVGLMIAARVTSSAAEIATMKVTNRLTRCHLSTIR